MFAVWHMTLDRVSASDPFIPFAPSFLRKGEQSSEAKRGSRKGTRMWLVRKGSSHATARQKRLPTNHDDLTLASQRKSRGGTQDGMAEWEFKTESEAGTFAFEALPAEIQLLIVEQLKYRVLYRLQ